MLFIRRAENIRCFGAGVAVGRRRYWATGFAGPLWPALHNLTESTLFEHVAIATSIAEFGRAWPHHLIWRARAQCFVVSRKAVTRSHLPVRVRQLDSAAYDQTTI